eukprot:221573-Karenia_brevis.AAC.1
MFRKVTAPDCPPVLAEKWRACGKDKEKKNELFGTYLACGGNAGIMEVFESIRRRDSQIVEETDMWMTLPKMIQEQVPNGDPELIEEVKKLWEQKCTQKGTSMNPYV